MSIPERFKDKDTIYHYTKLSTAIEYILYNEELLLSPRINSFDPIENLKPRIIYSLDETLKRNSEELELCREFIEERLNNAKQLSFCKNDYETFNYENYYHIPLEYYGFLKPRMWDQYGDKYNGVCLAFSLSELKKNTKIYNNHVIYRKYSNLEQNHLNVKQIELYKKGIGEYKVDLDLSIKKLMCEKHKDYQGEMEYRFISFSSDDKVLIKKSIIGVIINRNTHENYKEIIKNYTNTKGIDLLYINWTNNSVSVITKEEELKLMESITSKIPTYKIDN